MPISIVKSNGKFHSKMQYFIQKVKNQCIDYKQRNDNFCKAVIENLEMNDK